MLLDENLFKPVKNAGICLIGIAVVGFAFHADSLRETGGVRWFIIVMAVWHLSTGIGMLSRKIWGFFLLKLYLYVLLLGFPIGTWIAVRSLKYIKENDIVRFFNSKNIKI
jgi:hypothetical protein